MTGVPEQTIFSDCSLSRRLERAEATASAAYVEARSSIDGAAAWIEVAGTYAMYDGPRSPMTQTFGLGMFEPLAAADLDRIEAFFHERGAPVFHEVSPLADKSAFQLLNERNYRPVEFSSVLFLPLCGWTADVPRNERVKVRLAGEADREIWARTAAEGWRGLTEFDDLLIDLMMVVTGRRGALSFLAELDGQPAAAGTLHVHEGVAMLAGASTIPAMRRQGAQNALLEGRLAYANQLGCDIAMMCAEPGSASQRNAERNGFRIAYTRIKWQLPHAPS